MNITYTQNGDYLIPNIIIRKTKPLGHYGRLRKAYLEMHRPIGHLAMQRNGTAPHDNAGGCLPDRKAKADTGTQHGRNAVSCPKAIGHD